MSPVVGLNPGAGVSAGAPTPLLDQLSVSASFGYSVRKLRAAYTGKAINVRRSSDNATTDIGFSIFGDLDLTALFGFVGNNDGFVATWYDQVGSGNLTSVSNATQPRIVHAGVIETTSEGNIAINFGVYYSVPGTNNATLQNTSITYNFGDSYTVHCCALPGPGAAGGVFGGIIYRQSNNVGSLTLDHNQHYQAAEYGQDNAGDNYAENNLTQQGPGGAFAIKFSCGNCTIQSRWTERTLAATGTILGINPVDFAPGFSLETYDGWLMEHIIFQTANAPGTADRAKMFSNQKLYYRINTSLLHDALAYQMPFGFSTRKLRKGYSGACMNVRRDSDNATKDIGFASNSLDTVGLVNFVTSNGAHPTANGFVVTWYDQGMWTNDVTQATAANQPQIVLAGSVITQNGKPTLLFNTTISGTVGLVNTAVTFSNTNPAFVGGLFMVMKSTITSFPAFSLSTPVAVFTNPVWTSIINGLSSGGWDTTINAGHIVDINGTGANAETGNLETTSTAAAPTGSISNVSQINIGFVPAVSLSSFAGYIGEIYIPGEGPQTGDIPTAHGNQKAYWGTP